MFPAGYGSAPRVTNSFRGRADAPGRPRYSACGGSSPVVSATMRDCERRYFLR